MMTNENETDILKTVLAAIKGQGSAEAYEAMIEDAERSAAEHRAAVAQMETRRQDMLLEAGDAALDKIDAEIATGRRRGEQLEAAVVKLRAKLEEAEAREEEERRAELRRDAELAVADERSALAAYETHAAAAAAALAEMAECRERIRQARAAVPNGDFGDAEAEVIAERYPQQYRTDHSGKKVPVSRHPVYPLAKTVKLPVPGSPSEMFWPK